MQLYLNVANLKPSLSAGASAISTNGDYSGFNGRISECFRNSIRPALDQCMFKKLKLL